MKIRSMILVGLVLFAFDNFAIGQNLYKVRKYEIGITGGILFEGQVHAKSSEEDLRLEKKNAFLGKLYFDIALGRSLKGGVFFNFSSLAFSNDNATASLRDTGIHFKYRFLFNKRFAIRPGAGIAYRFFGSSSETIQNGGLATNASVEFIYALTKDNTKLLADLGFFAQPYGQSNDYSITIPPIPYVTLGLAF